MRKLIVLRGLPGCGKSTRSAEIAKTLGSKACVVSRDNIREAMYAGHYERSYEAVVVKMRDSMIKTALNMDLTPIVDDTNLTAWHMKHLRGLATSFNDVEVVVVDLRNVPLDTCVERDSKREGRKHVGEATIRTMAKLMEVEIDKETTKTYAGVYDRSRMPKAIIVDLDGTVFLKGHRSAFNEVKVYDDIVNTPVWNAVQALQAFTQAKLIFCSGRTAGCMDETIRCMVDKLGLTGDITLHMRKVGDRRQDAVVKHEIYENHIEPKYNVVTVFDDRQQVVDMWRRLGLTCFQVAAGDF